MNREISRAFSLEIPSGPHRSNGRYTQFTQMRRVDGRDIRRTTRDEGSPQSTKVTEHGHHLSNACIWATIAYIESSASYRVSPIKHGRDLCYLAAMLKRGRLGAQRATRSGAWAALGFLITTCTNGKSETPSPTKGGTAPSPSAVVEHPPVRWSGCREVRRSEDDKPICYAKADGTLTFFIPDTNTTTDISVIQNEKTLPIKRQAVLDGAQVTLEEFSLDTDIKIKRGSTEVFSLSIRKSAIPPEIDELAVRGKIADGMLVSEAIAALTPFLQSDNPVHRARALSVHARRQTETATAIKMLREAIRLHRENDLVSDEYSDRVRAHFIRVFQARRMDEADDWLPPLEALGHLHPEGEAHRKYHLGTAGLYGRSIHKAMDYTSEALFAYQALGHPDVDSARFNLIQLFLAVGRNAEAKAQLEVMKPKQFAASPGCSRLPDLMNYGLYTAALARAQPRSPEMASARRWADVVVQTLQARCPKDLHQGQIYKAYAIVGLFAGDVELTRRALQAAKPHVNGQPVTKVVLDRFAAHASLLEGKANEALDGFRVTEERARQLDLPESLREALLGQAKALVALQRTDKALAVLERAEATLDDQVKALPIGLGKETFLASNENIGILHVKLLVDQGRSEAALQAVLRGHRRGLTAFVQTTSLDRLSPEQKQLWQKQSQAYLDARAEAQSWWAGQPKKWTLSIEKRAKVEAIERTHRLRRRELLNRAMEILGDADPHLERPAGSPRRGQALLAFHPLPELKWSAFLKTDDQKVQVAVASGDADLDTGTVTALLGRLEFPSNVEHVAVLQSQVLKKIDWDMVWVDDQPVANRWTVALALDIEPPTRRSTLRRALVIQSDPGNTLEFEDAEASMVRDTLLNQGFEVVSIGGKGEPPASITNVRKALSDPTFTLVHFVGHGNRVGLDGWQSGIMLEGEARFTAADVLMLKTVPPVVVLSACSTGESGEGRIAAGLGLTQAFMLRGATWVMGTTEVVDDSTSLAFSRQLYGSEFPALLLAWPRTRAHPPVIRQSGYYTWQVSTGPPRL